MKEIKLELSDKIAKKLLKTCKDEEMTPSEWVTQTMEDYDS